MNDRTLRLTAGQPVHDLFRYAIGLEKLLFESNAGNFPPHNIERLTNDHYILTLALAGFTRSDIEITLFKGILKISGSKSEEPTNRVLAVDRPVYDGGSMKELVDVQSEFLYKGIAYRDFVREFTIGEHVEIKSATMQNGLLVISLERNVPESETPQVIPIS